MHLQTRGTQCFQLRISLPEVTGHSTSSAPVNLSALLEDYHDFADVFSKSKAGKLAEHQPYDLKITLDKGTVPPFSPIYSLSQEGLAALCKFIDENLPQGSSVPHTPLVEHQSSSSGRKTALFDIALTSEASTGYPKRIDTHFCSSQTC